jgi:hypothetical protein
MEKRANASVDPLSDCPCIPLALDAGRNGTSVVVYFPKTFFTWPTLFSTLPLNFSTVPSS